MTKALFASKPPRNLVQLNAIHFLKKRNCRHRKKKTIVVSSKSSKISISKHIISTIKEPTLRLERMSDRDRLVRRSAGVPTNKSIEECHNPPHSLSHYRVHEHKEWIESVLLTHRHELFAPTYSPRVIRHVIRKKALKIADALHVPRRKFKGTNKWLNSFLEKCKHLGYITASFKLKTTECTENGIKTSNNNLPTPGALEKVITSEKCLESHHILKTRLHEKNSPIHIPQNNGHYNSVQNEFLPSEVESVSSKGSIPITPFSKHFTEPSLCAIETLPNDTANLQLQSKDSYQYTAQLPKVEDLFATSPVSSHRTKCLDQKKYCMSLNVKNSVADFKENRRMMFERKLLRCRKPYLLLNSVQCTSKELLPHKSYSDYQFLKVSSSRVKPSKYSPPTFSDDIFEKLYAASNAYFGALYEKKQVVIEKCDEDLESGYRSRSVSHNSEPDKLSVSFQPADPKNMILGSSHSPHCQPMLSVTSRPSVLCPTVANAISVSTKLFSTSSDKSSTSEHSILSTTFPVHCNVGSNEALKKFSSKGATIDKTISGHTVEMLSEHNHNYDNNILKCCESMEYIEHHDDNCSTINDVYYDDFDISHMNFRDVDNTYFNADMVNDGSWINSLLK